MPKPEPIWAYSNHKGGPLAEMVAVTPQTGDGFMFATPEDRARFRRQIEDALRKTASDWDQILVADILKVRLD